MSQKKSTPTADATIHDRVPSPVRYALNYKGLPYKTVWLERHEIEQVAKKVGAKATKVKPNGWDSFIDLSRRAQLNDSAAIGILGTRCHSSTTSRQAL